MKQWPAYLAKSYQEKYANHCGEVQVCCMNSFTAEANCWHGKTKCVSG